MALIAGCGSGRSPASGHSGELRISIEQRLSGPWVVTYETGDPTSSLDLGRDIDGYRSRNWKILDENARLSSEDGADRIVSANGHYLPARVTVEVTPSAADYRKDYEPFISMGDGGVLLYTGHFIPLSEDEERLPAKLTIIPAVGGVVSAFGTASERFEDWESPYEHPAFIYVGKAGPENSGAMSAIIDATAPKWIAEEVADFAPTIAASLQALLERSLPATPNIFVAIGDLSEEGRLSYSGDALPGQYQMTLAGGVWREKSDQALAVLRRNTAHEAAHLWQAAARPKSDAVGSWIHEGGANALAAAALASAGYWSDEERQADFAAARAECEKSLSQLSLQKAEAEKRWDAVYACGQVINVAAAGEAGVAAFWREFVRRSARSGFDETDFIALAEEQAGPKVAQAIRDLVRINDARPDLVIDRMFP
jgi:hypothetical protein